MMSANSTRNRAPANIEGTCWVCGGHSLEFARHGVPPSSVNSEDFNITSSQYGVTGELHRCRNCGFLQSTGFREVLHFYEELEDPDYEKSRGPRSLQARKIMNVISRQKPSGRLLDIGAGSGILIEQALKLGYLAEGVEPSAWLQSKAKQSGFQVYSGSFPNSAVQGVFDVICMIDVLEHIRDPMGLLEHIPKYLAAGGVLVVITPDVHSLTARLMRSKWWHYRIAHVGYFDQHSLDVLFDRVGLRRVGARHATWYFSLGYLLVRLGRYMPGFWKPRYPRFLDRVVLQLDLGDSIMAFYAAKQ